MSELPQPVVGSIVERRPSAASTSSQPLRSGKSGFPDVHHRSKSAFTRYREESQRNGSRLREVPVVVSVREFPELKTETGTLQEQIRAQNQALVNAMTEEEREESKREIIARFGAGVGDLLKRVQEARKHPKAPKVPSTDSDAQATEDLGGSLEEVPITREGSHDRLRSLNRKSPPPPALSTSSTRPSSRAGRHLRFAEPSPEDVHVYESAPSSPRRKVFALPPPPDDGSAIPLVLRKGKEKPQPPRLDRDMEDEPTEGTPEYIRRRYFPNAPANDPNLAWIDATPMSDSEPGLRFDLAGKPIPPSLSLTLPTHLGLHHHAEGTHAGYTLDDIFLLSRASVPAQRATMLGVLARIAHRLGKLKNGIIEDMGELAGKEEELRKRIMAAGVEAMSERGSVGARAIEVIWCCVVDWDESSMGIDGIELESDEDAAMNSIPLEFILPQVVTLLSQEEISPEISVQLLDILRRLARQSGASATSIATTPSLISKVVQVYLLTPFPPTDASPLPNPSALDLLIVLARTSRSNAVALQDIGDVLLRFVAILPPSSLYTLDLATSLCTFTLRFYTVLATYGLYSHIASTAMDNFAKLGRYVSSTCTSRELMVAWTDLLEAWTVCAIDPHRTTTPHDILWSQIVSWSWYEEVELLRDQLGEDGGDCDAWAGVWKVNAAWLEGASINGTKGGASEKLERVGVFKDRFESDKEGHIVRRVIESLGDELSQLAIAHDKQDLMRRLRSLARHAKTLTAAIRLWLSCLSPICERPLPGPPFPLPFPQISALCAKLTVHPLWSLFSKFPYTYTFGRSLSGLLSYYLRLSRQLPGISEQLWMAQTFAVLGRLLPGDEESALRAMDELANIFSPGWTTLNGIAVPPIFWETGGISIIMPFLSHSLRPRDDIYVGPLHPTPQSIMLATTQILPPASVMPDFGLPADRDWTLSPLDHLLRSGSSTVFKSLPPSWDASETEITRATLLFTRFTREILSSFSLTDFILTREEATFGCMKVFMLEHGQPQNDSAEEVFRGRTVGELTDNLLQPYTFEAYNTTSPTAATSNLEKVATRFLGKTPFYQYYTDFVALYDATSFSHPLFARLLLPATSLRYAIDYRNHLWGDYSHLLQTIRTPVEQVITHDVREYLFPIESDPRMIGHYLRALLKDSLQGILYLVATHHVASNIWQDIYTDGGWNEERAQKLLSAVAEQGNAGVVKAVVRYQQRTTGPVTLPPHCFVVVPEVETSRMECVRRRGGSDLADRLQGLFL